MNGIELARVFYEDYGRKMLEQKFGDILAYLAVGFTGRGSEHYGYDDDVSRDHDYEPGFMIFLPKENIIDRKKEFELERAYSKLPKEYCGFHRQLLAPVGGARNGVVRTADYFMSAIGSPDGRLSDDAWLHIPDWALAEAVNGEIFSDNLNEVSEIRERILNMPKNIKLKRIAGNLLIMGQAGQYNFLRCVKHGESEAAQFACVRFAEYAMKTVFLLNGRYMPYYKWSFRALKDIEGTEKICERLTTVLFGDNRDTEVVRNKTENIEEISAFVVKLLKKNGFTNENSEELEKQAYAVNNEISESSIRNLHILETIPD